MREADMGNCDNMQNGFLATKTNLVQKIVGKYCAKHVTKIEMSAKLKCH